MKKAMSLFLALGMTAALLAGCGGSGSSSTSAAPAASAQAPVSTPAALSGTVSTNGSTSMEKVIGALSEQFMADHSGVTVSYDPTGSGAGIEAAGNGTCDIGLSSRALKEEETGLTGTTVALDGIAIIVNAENPVDDLSVDQIAQLFTGAATDWSAVGGNAGAVACIGRESGSGQILSGMV